MYIVKVFQNGSLIATEERKMSIIDCTYPEPKGEDIEVSLLGHFILPAHRESGIYKLNQPVGETIRFDVAHFIHPEGKELKYELLDAVAVVEVEDMNVKKYSIHIRAKKISVARILLVAILEGRLSPSISFEKVGNGANALERVDNLISTLHEESQKEYTKFERLMMLYDSFVERATKNNVAVIVYVGQGKTDQTLIKILPSGKYCQTSTKKLNKDEWEWSQELPRKISEGASSMENYLRNENAISRLFTIVEKNDPNVQIRIEVL